MREPLSCNFPFVQSLLLQLNFVVFVRLLTDLPVVLAMSGRIYLPRGMLGRIECPVEANPPATRIVWSVNEQIIDPDRTPRIRVNKLGALVLRSVEKEDEGRYSCRPYSPLGSGQMSLPVQVFVRGERSSVVLGGWMGSCGA